MAQRLLILAAIIRRFRHGRSRGRRSSQCTARDRRAESLLNSELFANEIAQGVSNLDVPRNRGATTIVRVCVHVVASSVPLEDAPCLSEFSEEVAALHTARAMERVRVLRRRTAGRAVRSMSR